jgi:tetratricopeptide (TPR) repeat protein
MQALAKSAGAQPGATASTTIRLHAAVSDAPYLARLRAVPADEMYRHYLDERASYTNSTAFILDVADLMFERGQSVLATRVLSNLAEMDLENRQVLRILGQRLVQAKRADLAVPVFRKVLVLAPDEPQSQRDLGLALAAAGQPQAAVEALYEVARHQWPRFPEIELIALAEMNAIIATSTTGLDTARIDPRLLKNLPLDLRATLSWDADNTDIDLWVTDPNGERAFYGNPLSYQGGRMSRDITSGYGPEEFSLKRAKPGKYTVQAQFYGHNQQIVSGATTIQLALTTGFGTAQHKQQAVTLRLRDRKDQVFVGEFVVD